MTFVHFKGLTMLVPVSHWSFPFSKRHPCDTLCRFKSKA